MFTHGPDPGTTRVSTEFVVVIRAKTPDAVEARQKQFLRRPLQVQIFNMPTPTPRTSPRRPFDRYAGVTGSVFALGPGCPGRASTPYGYVLRPVLCRPVVCPIPGK